MSIAINDRRVRQTTFILLMLSINLIDGMVIRSIADPGRRLIVAAGASFDVVVVVSALYYWMLVRPGIRAPGTLVAMGLIGGLHATCFYPDAVVIRAIAAGLCEAGLIGFVILQVRRSARRTPGARGDSDPLDTISAALARVPALPVVANLLAAELGILYYGLFSWRANPHVASGARAFTIHARVGQADVFVVAAIAGVLEIVPVHLVLRHWSPTLAWIATCLGLYIPIWLIGLARAFRLRPTIVGRDYLHIRYGLLYQLLVRKEMIASVRRAGAGDRRSAVPRNSEPSLCIELVQAVEAIGPFGIRKRVQAVAVTPDDEKAFGQALAELISIG